MIVALAIFVEAIWDSLKTIKYRGKINWNRTATLLIGVLVSVITRTDLLAAFGIANDSSIIGYVLTGIVIGRGGSYIHRLLKRIGSPIGENKGKNSIISRQKKKNENKKKKSA